MVQIKDTLWVGRDDAVVIAETKGKPNTRETGVFLLLLLVSLVSLSPHSKDVRHWRALQLFPVNKLLLICHRLRNQTIKLVFEN